MKAASRNYRGGHQTAMYAFEYLVAFVFLLSAYSVYFKSSQFSSLMFESLLAALGFCWIASLIDQIDPSSVLRFFTLSLFSLMMVLICWLLTSDNAVISYVAQKSVILVVLIPLYGLIFSTLGFETTVNQFISKVINCLAILCVIGLLLWIAVAFINVKLPSIVLQYNWGGEKTAFGYLGIEYITQIISFAGRTIPQFTLFFVEAPLANFVFQLCLSAEILLIKHPRKLIVLVLSLSSLASFSTTGIILLPLIWFCGLATSKTFRAIRKNYIPINFLYCLSLSVLAIALPFWSIYSLQSKKNTDSLETHGNDIISGIKSFLDSPIWGHGLGDYTSSYRNFGGSDGSSSGIIAVSAQAGILLLVLYLLPFGVQLISFTNKQKLHIL
ncbi:MAG: hypothetical protein ABF780_09405 [Bifidobacterium aquikefiri]|uniref:O-antigen ligase like membrane protein n=2 Tax=Bifidobacterium aquikefiri TaxID=1653207 RepID=A0A261G3L5_9BIFI|nr:hypothetical protein [Bifidobacterium aquikefiri]OZG65606.1 O-antigen ligase like membrane protein [Bifidobacterium aquikefiri]